MPRAARDVLAFDPRNPGHVFIGPGHPLWILRELRVSASDIHGLVALVKAKLDPNGQSAGASPAALERRRALAQKIKNSRYLVERATQALPAFNALMRLSPSAILFCQNPRDAELLTRIASQVKKNDLDFMLRHTAGAQELLDEARSARMEQRDAEKHISAVERARDQEFRRLAGEGIAAISRIHSVEHIATTTLNTLKTKARTNADHADRLEDEAYKLVRAMMTEKATGKGRIEGDITGRARRRTDEAKSIGRAFSDSARQANRLADKLEAAWARMDPKLVKFMKWVQANNPETVAKMTGLSIHDARILADTGVVGRVKSLRMEAARLHAECKVYIQKTLTMASRELVHKSIARAFGNDEEGARRAAHRLYHRIMEPERKANGNRKEVWDYTGIVMSPATAKAMGIRTFGQTMQVRLSPAAMQEVRELAMDHEREIRLRETGSPFRAPASTGRYSSSFSGSTVTFTATPGQTSIREGVRTAPGASTVGYTPPSSYAMAATYGRGRLMVYNDPGARGPRTEVYYKSSFGFGLGRKETEVITRFGRARTVPTTEFVEYAPGKFMARTSLTAHHDYATAQLVRGVDRQPRIVTARSLERRELYIPGRPSARVLGRYDLRGLPLLSEINDFRDYHDAAHELRQKQKYNNDLFKTENRRQYSGYGTGNANEAYLDRITEQDWARRQGLSLPSAMTLAGKPQLNLGLNSLLYTSFGDNLFETDFPQFRTAQEAIQSGEVGHVAIFNWSKSGKKAHLGAPRVEFNLKNDPYESVSGAAGERKEELGPQTTFQVLPNGTVRRVTTSNWQHWRNLEASIATAQSLEQLSPIIEKILTGFDPKFDSAMLKDLRKRTGISNPFTDEHEGKVYIEELLEQASNLHPAVQELVRQIKERVPILRQVDVGALQEEPATTEVEQANKSIKITRATLTNKWATNLEAETAALSSDASKFLAAHGMSDDLELDPSGMESLDDVREARRARRQRRKRLSE